MQAHTTHTATQHTQLAQFMDTIKRLHSEQHTPTLNIITRHSILHYYTMHHPVAHYQTRNTYTPTPTPTIIHTRTTLTLQPRKFYRTSQIEAYLTQLEKRIHRQLEADEATLILRHITTGRTYTITALIPHDISDTPSAHVWDNTPLGQ